MRPATSSLSSVTAGRRRSASSVNGRALASAIEAPAKVTARASTRRPLPWQVGQVVLRTKGSTLARIASLVTRTQHLAHVPAGAAERAVVVPTAAAVLVLGADQDRRLLVGEEQPVPVLRGQLAPGTVHVDAEVLHDAPQVVRLPGARPGGDRAVADAQRRCRGPCRSSATSCTTPRPWHSGQAPAAVFGEKASAARCVGAGRVAAGPRVEDPQQVGQRGDGADRRPGARRAPALLQGHGGRQPRDLLHVGRADLVEQAAGVGRDGLEVATLRLGVQRAEGQRGLPGAGDAGERDDRVARQVDVDVAEVVLARAPDAYEPVVLLGAHLVCLTDARGGADHGVSDERRERRCRERAGGGVAGRLVAVRDLDEPALAAGGAPERHGHRQPGGELGGDRDERVAGDRARAGARAREGLGVDEVDRDWRGRTTG